MRIGVIGGSSEGCECGLGPRHGGEGPLEETSSPESPLLCVTGFGKQLGLL